MSEVKENDDLNLEEIIEKYNKPHLAEEPGMVYQVWGDGEVTLTKSGDLLGHRNLHMINFPVTSEMLAVRLMDDKDRPAHKTYLYTDEEGALAVREWINNCNHQFCSIK